MLFNLFEEGFDLLTFARDFLISLPVVIIALIFHETAHAFVAYRRGDPTAKILGRLTLNPLRHLDPMGLLFMFVVGVGWAKPVPVNPRNFKHPRRDDFLVSIAGIVTNLLLSLISLVCMFIMITLALKYVPQSAYEGLYGGYFATSVQGKEYALSAALAYQAAFNMDLYLITPFLGAAPGYIYSFFVQLFIVNLSLALFNLLPIPPLDGYHVLNDLILRGKQLFASPRMQRAGSLIMVVLLISGLLDKALSFVINHVAMGAGAAMEAAARFTGLI